MYSSMRKLSNVFIVLSFVSSGLSLLGLLARNEILYLNIDQPLFIAFAVYLLIAVPVLFICLSVLTRKLAAELEAESMTVRMLLAEKRDKNEDA